MEISYILNKHDFMQLKSEFVEEVKEALKGESKPSRFMKSSEVRSLLGGISAAKLQNLRVGGHLPAIDADGMWLYDYNDIIDFLESHKINGKEDSNA